jgi:threonine dehydrogenase-like Zn-dependent dehydrogenase
MKAAIIASPGTIDMVEVSVPTPDDHQALIHVEACGVCASNLPRWEGKPWFTYPTTPGELGHEGIGTIVGLGRAVDQWQLGQRVAFLSNHAYAEYDLASAAEMVLIPEQLADICIPGEPLACAWNIFDRTGIGMASEVAIVGGGFLAALLIQLAVNAGARVMAVTRRPFSPAVREVLGQCDPVVVDDPAKGIERVQYLTEGRMCDVVIEATGKQEPLDLAAKLTRIRGRLVIAGYHQDGPRQVDMQLWNWRGIDVINAHERDPSIYIEGMRQAYAASLQGILNPEPLLTHHLLLSELGQALELARLRPEGFMKAIVHL